MPRMKENECQRVPLPEAAKVLGMDPDSLRQAMLRKEIDLGIILPPRTKGGRRQYIVLRTKLDKLIGKETA